MIYDIFGIFDRLSIVILIIMNNYIDRTPYSSTVTFRQLVRMLNLECGEAQAAARLIRMLHQYYVYY